MGPGEEAVSPGWERLGQKGLLGAPCQEPKIQVNDPRRKRRTRVLRTLPGSTTANGRETAGLRPRGRDENVLTSPGRRNPGQPEV